MADDPGRQPGNNMETPRRVWKPKAISDPGLQVETFAGQPYFRVPYYYLALPNEKIMLMHMQKDMGTVLDTRGSTLRTNTSRFMMNVEEFNPKTHLVVRSLHKLKVVTACNSPGVFMCDNSDLEGFDLITPKGLMILFRAKIDRLKYDKNKMAAPAMAGVCGQLFERLFDEMGDKGKQVVLDSTYGIKFGSYISRNTLNSIIMHGWLKADAITGNENGFPGRALFRVWFQYSLDWMGVLPVMIKLCLQGHVGKHFANENREYHVVNEFKNAGFQPAKMASNSTNPPEPMSRSPGPFGDKKKAGRPASSFQSKICVLNDPYATPQSQCFARMWLCYGHYLTLKGLKILNMWDLTSPVGFSTDDHNVSGRETAGCRIRGKFLDRPICPGPPIPITISLPPLQYPRVNAREIEDAIRRMAAFRVDKDAEQQFSASAKYAALIKSASRMFSGMPLGLRRRLLHTSDKGSLQRGVPCYLMIAGYPCLAFFDGPHIFSNAMRHIATKYLPQHFGRFLSTRSTAGKSQSCKVGNILMRFCELTDQVLVDAIADDIENLAAEVGANPNDSEEVVQKFRERCWSTTTDICQVNNKRFAKYNYGCMHLFECFTTHQTAWRVIEIKETGKFISRLQARVEVVEKEETKYKLMQLNQEDLDALQQVLLGDSSSAQIGDLGAKLMGPGEEESDDEGADAVQGGNEGEAQGEQPDAGQDAGGLGEDEQGAEGGETGAGDNFFEGAKITTKGRKKKGKMDRTELFLKEDEKKLCRCMHQLFSSPDSRARIFIYHHITSPILFGHALQIGLDFTGILARGMNFNLPIVVVSEVCERFRRPIPVAFRSMAEFSPNFALHFGKCALDTIAAAVTVALEGMSQHQRLLMYGCNPERDNSIKNALENWQEFDQSLQWILRAPETFTSCPELFGTKDGVFKSVYCIDITEANDPTPGSKYPDMIESGIGFKKTFRRSCVEYELGIADASREMYQRSATYKPAATFAAFLLYQPDYLITNEMLQLLRDGATAMFKDEAQELIEHRVPSTRDIEAGGASYTRATRKANASGSMKETMPWHLAQTTNPEWIPWQNPQQPEDMKLYDVNGLDSAGKSCFGRRFATKGITNSFSELDGRVPTGMSTEEYRRQFWEIRRLEDFMPLVPPGRVDEWAMKWMEEVDKKFGDDDDAKEDALTTAYDEFVAAHKNAPIVAPQVIRKGLEEVLKVDKDDTGLTPEALNDLATKKYNPEHRPKTVVAEHIAYEYRVEFLSHCPQFQHQLEMGKTHCDLLVGAHQRMTCVSKPFVLRVKPWVGCERYFVVTHIWKNMQVLVLLELSPIEWNTDRLTKDGKLRHKPAAAGKSTAAAGIGPTMGVAEPASEDAGDLDWETDLNHKEREVGRSSFVEKDVDDLYFTFHSGPENCRLPIQLDAGHSAPSKFKFMLCLSQSMSHYSNDDVYSLDICPTATFELTGQRYVTIRLHNMRDPSSTCSTLEMATRMGFGTLNRWSLVSASSGLAECKKIVVHLIEQNPHLLDTLTNFFRADDADPWNLERKCREYKNAVDADALEGEGIFDSPAAQPEAPAEKDLSPILEEPAEEKPTDEFGYDPETSKFKYYEVFDVDMTPWGSKPEHWDSRHQKLRDPVLLKLPHYLSARGVLSPRQTSTRKVDPQPAATDANLDEEMPDAFADEPMPDADQQPNPAGVNDTEDAEEKLGAEDEELLNVEEEQEKGTYVQDGKTYVTEEVCAKEVRNVKMDARMWMEILTVLQAGSIDEAIQRLIEKDFYPTIAKKKKAKQKCEDEEGQVLATCRMTCQNFLFTLQHLGAKRLGDPKKKPGPGPHEDDLLSGENERDEHGKASAAAVKKSLKAAHALVGDAGYYFPLVKPGVEQQPEEIDEEFLANEFCEMEDEHEGDPNRDHYLECDKEKEQALLQELTTKYVEEATIKETKAYDGARDLFEMHPDVDVLQLQAAENLKKFWLKCRKCKKKICYYTRHYLGPSGPMAKCYHPTDKSKKFTRSLGPHSHFCRPGFQDSLHIRCMCGVHKDGLVYTTEECEEVAPADHLWRCAEVFMELSARFENWMCTCSPPVNPKDLMGMKPSQTFGKRSAVYKMKSKSEKGVKKPEAMKKSAKK